MVLKITTTETISRLKDDKKRSVAHLRNQPETTGFFSTKKQEKNEK